MLDFHLLEQCYNLWDKLKIVLEQLAFEHRGEIFGNFFSLLETTLQIVGYFCDVWHIVVLRVLVVLLAEFELHLIC